MRDEWVDTGHGGDGHRGLMRGEPEEKRSKDREGVVRRREGVIDGAARRGRLRKSGRTGL